MALFLCLLLNPASAMVKSIVDKDLERYAIMVLGSKGSFCTAIIIKQDILLTAAHCVTGSSEYRAHWRNSDGTHALEKLAAIAIHPGYVKNAVLARKRSIDIAILKLPVPLPNQFKAVDLSDRVPQLGDILKVGGYGLSKENDPSTGGIFRTATLSMIEPYGRSSILLWLSDPHKNPKANGAGACTGDSGGPIFDVTGSLVAVTVYAEGHGKENCGAITQGVLIKPIHSFIDETIKKWKM